MILSPTNKILRNHQPRSSSRMMVVEEEQDEDHEEEDANTFNLTKSHSNHEDPKIRTVSNWGSPEAS